jgi:hypothetical protein
LHNPTQGFHRDIQTCIKGRVVADGNLDIVKKLCKELTAKARNKGTKIIVVIAHSLGTIIASTIVRQLSKGSPLRNRMEFFHFAFCADEFPGAQGRDWRLVEHFANENDLVPSLSISMGRGIPAVSPYNVPGAVFLRRDAWGHLLNAHYLDRFGEGDYRDAGGHNSTLYSYLGGKRYGT